MNPIAVDETLGIGGNKVEMKIENLPIQIKDSMNIDSFNGITMLGRYAEWNHKVKLNEVVDRLVKLKTKVGQHAI